MEVYYLFELSKEDLEHVNKVLDFWIEKHPKYTLEDAHPIIMLYRRFFPLSPSNREEYP